MTVKNERKKIAMLRSNPKDATFGKIPLHLVPEYSIECYVWDRQGDYKPLAQNADITYKKCRIRARFHTPGTFLKLLGFEFWLFIKLLFSRYDCIHAIDLDTGLVGLIISKIRSKPYVYHCIDPYYGALPASWPSMLGSLAKKIENYVITNADFFIITDLLRMQQHEGARAKRVVEILNVPHIDVSTDSEKIRPHFIAGYIGSLIEGRNLRTIIESIGELNDNSVKLIIGGFGPLEDEIRTLCSRYPNIEFHGWVPYSKVLDLERIFDVLLHITDPAHPGQKWVSPNKLFESMALGKPLIAGEGTLTGARVSKTGNGITVPYGSKPDLQKSVLLLKENADLVKEMGRRGLQEYERNWRPEIMKERLLSAYRILFA